MGISRSGRRRAYVLVFRGWGTCGARETASNCFLFSTSWRRKRDGRTPCVTNHPRGHLPSACPAPDVAIFSAIRDGDLDTRNLGGRGTVLVFGRRSQLGWIVGGAEGRNWRGERLGCSAVLGGRFRVQSEMFLGYIGQERSNSLCVAFAVRFCISCRL